MELSILEFPDSTSRVASGTKAGYVPRIMRWILPCGSPAVLCGAVLSAAILMGHTVFPAQGQALSLPSHTPEHHDGEGHAAPPSSMTGLSLPRPLSAAVAAHYKALFVAVREGNAARLAELTHGGGRSDGTVDHLLLPDYLAERYLSTAFHPSEAELADWLHHYSALPDAPFLQQKLDQLGKGKAAAEVSASFGYENVADLHQVERATPFSQTLNHNGPLERDLMDKAAQGGDGIRKALAQLRRTPGVTPAYAAQLHGEIAMQALSQGDTRTALRVGSAGLEAGHYKVGLPAFVAGLAAWREGQLDAAYSLFEIAANAEQTDGDVQAAASFWAGRVAERHGDRSLYRTWLHRASVQSESFYGLLAGRLLRTEHSPGGALSGVLSTMGLAGAKKAALSEVDINVVASMEEGAHLFALLQIGEQGRAEMLARQMWQGALVDPVRAHSLQLVVRKAGMFALADQMQHALERVDHKELKEVFGPLPELHPYHGFRLSSALVYAVARMESNFDATASSNAGAYGMMQVRPTTAGFVSEQYHLAPVVPDASSGDEFNQEMEHRLLEPGYNLEVGQLYMLYLARSIAQSEQSDEASLLKVLASYNAGPQAIIRWESGQKDLQDPLMFIECLPSPETRQYVRNVLTNDWVYGRRLHVATPSLVALAGGHWPSFREEEQGRDSPS